MTDAERGRRFDALFRAHLADITSYCRWRTGSGGDEQDAVAEVFLIAWRKLEDVPAGGHASRWLYATARGVVANLARANARSGRLARKLSSQRTDVHGQRDPALDRVHEALAAISPDDREVLLLAEWERLSPAESAHVMGTKAVTGRGRLPWRGAASGPRSNRRRAPVTPPTTRSHRS